MQMPQKNPKHPDLGIEPKMLDLMAAGCEKLHFQNKIN